MPRQTYPSDINEKQWKTISQMIHPHYKQGRTRSTNEREVINAINYRWSTGCSWRMLPHDFPTWSTVYSYFRIWSSKGILREIRTKLICRKEE